MNNVGFHIRRMEKGDLPAAIDIKNEEGWNQTLKDWEFLFFPANLPQQFLISWPELG